MKRVILGSLLLATSLLAKGDTIAKIKEASGICFIEDNKTLVIVNDEGSIYELDTNGHIKREKKLGDYDLEGVTYDKSTRSLLVAVEGDDAVMIVDYSNFGIKAVNSVNRIFNGKTLLKKDKKSGLEAIAIDGKTVYVSNQSKKSYPKEDASVIAILDDVYSSKSILIKDIIDHGYKDVAGMTFHNGYLYFVSDKKSKLIEYDVKKMKTNRVIKLRKSSHQEGIAFDNIGNFYIADDKGKILKYNFQEEINKK
jgi:uncharacterized protein YjiK